METVRFLVIRFENDGVLVSVVIIMETVVSTRIIGDSKVVVATFFTV